MSIKHAILGMLSDKPLTGYELKKIMKESPFMYWSGNNNQIYKALVELYDEGFVDNEVHHQDGSPSKKVYTITNDGLKELKKWSLSEPAIPEIKKPFLVQLAWTAQLDNSQLEQLLAQYKEEIKGKILIEQKKIQNRYFAPDRTPREIAIWDFIYKNILNSYKNELDWINQVREAVKKFDNPSSAEFEEENDIAASAKVMKEMNHQTIEKNNKNYIMLSPLGKLIQTEQDALQLVSICAEHGTNRLLIPSKRLSNDFLRLSTQAAALVLQKFINYNIKVAVVLNTDNIKGKFKDFLAENNNSNMFRVYDNFEHAEKWLVE